MNTYRIKYRTHRGAEPSARLIEANTVREARLKLGQVWSISIISIQCNGHTESGDRCQRFTCSDTGYCCEVHQKSAMRNMS